MTPSYVTENANQRARLQALVSRLSDEDLKRPVFDEWTVAGLLGHIAFWDSRALLLLRKWKQTGTDSPVEDFNVLNDAMRPLLLSIPPHKAAEFALEAAERIDQEIEELPASLLAEIESKVKGFRPDRGHHRQSHITDIEAALRKGK